MLSLGVRPADSSVRHRDDWRGCSAPERFLQDRQIQRPISPEFDVSPVRRIRDFGHFKATVDVIIVMLPERSVRVMHLCLSVCMSICLSGRITHFVHKKCYTHGSVLL